VGFLEAEHLARLAVGQWGFEFAEGGDVRDHIDSPKIDHGPS
jgi:hypothetical protein